MKKIKLMFLNNKKASIACVVTLLVVVVIAIVAITNQKEVVALKQDTFNVAVNSELDKTPDSYISGMKNPEDASINDEFVKMDVLGTYDLIITYKQIEYKVKINVQDLEKPVISLLQDKYVFSLNSTVDEVNETINEDITITDNYDKEFDLLTIVDSIPETEKEVDVKLSIKDTSDNESDVISLTIQFTEDGEQKDGLEKEVKEVKTTAKASISDPTVTPTQETEQEVDPIPEKEPEPTPDNGTATKPEQTSPPQTKPKPEQITPPKQEPTTPPATTPPSYTIPEGALNGGEFDNRAQGERWAFDETDNPDSIYYHCNVGFIHLSNGKWVFWIEP